MVIERAALNIVPGKENAFERVFPDAVPFIAATPGFRGLQLARGVESPAKYLLSVSWDSVEAHHGFRGTDSYAEWGKLLHPFFDPDNAPSVEHTSTVFET